MSSSGGSAAINGFLYQILANLGNISKFHLSFVRDKNTEDIESARLILEPKGGGGDARYEYGGIRIVEQYKTRSGNRKWSLDDLIHDVLPDLFRAVDAKRLDEKCKFRFVTNGRFGRLVHFERFLQTFSSQKVPTNPISALDDKNVSKFFNNDSCTARELFLRIAVAIKPKDGSTDMITHYQKLWHLFANFEMEYEISASDFKRGIDEFLIQVVDAREDVESKRRELCTIIMELSAEGDVDCTPQDIFQRAGLDAIPLSNLSHLKQKLRECMEEVFRKKGYDPKMDVRSAPGWPEEYPILLLAGESGQGKTWQLFRLANDLQKNGNSVVIVSSSGDAEKTLQEASDSVWLDCLSHDHPIYLRRLTAKYQKIHDLPDSPWLTICIDNVQDLQEIQFLVDQPWEKWKIKLALTIPLEYGKRIAHRQPKECTSIDVKDFTPYELLVFWGRNNYKWGRIPEDVIEILCRPLLASIYCKIATEAEWTPLSAYELYETYWETMIYKNGEHPDDMNIFLRAAGSLLEKNAKYPWDYSQREQVCLKEEISQRLEKIGLLRRLGRNDIEVWHDRILNWAVAEWLIEQQRTGKMQLSELQNILLQMLFKEKIFAEKRLRYVPMDYLWLACNPSNNVDKNVVPILEKMLKSIVFQTKVSQANIPSPILGSITQEIIKIVTRAPNLVKDLAIKFIQEQDKNMQELGMKILQEFPDPRALDILWAIHKEHFNALQDSPAQKDYSNYEVSHKALKTCVQFDLSWLLKKIQEADPVTEAVSELGWLVANIVDSSEARNIWNQTKELLFEKVQSHKLRSLIRCIGRFKDTTKIDKLRSWLTCKNDHVNMAAFRVLCQLAPDKALTYIEILDINEAVLCRTWWIPELFLRVPQQTRQMFISIAKKHENACLYLSSIYLDFENFIDTETLNVFLESLESKLSEQIEQILTSDKCPPWFYRALTFITHIHRLELLQVIQKRANTPLESLLSRIAPKYLRDYSVFERIYKVLCKTCGQGLTDVTNRELESEERGDRVRGLENVLRRNDDKTHTLLCLMSQSEHPDRFEQNLAKQQLALIDNNYSNINVALRSRYESPWPTEFSALLEVKNVDNELIKEAFNPRTIFPQRATSAIKGLWDLDPDVAGQAVIKQLRDADSPDSHLPKVLVHLSENRAVELLCNHIQNEKRIPILWAIGRALRLVKNKDMLESNILKMLSKPDRNVRKAAIEVTGWQSPGFLKKELQDLALNDFDDEVSQKAIEALQRQTEQEWVEELIQAFKTASSCQRWSLLDSILELGDPFCLHDGEDPLWLGPIPSQYRNFVSHKLNKRKGTVKQEAKKKNL